MRQLEISITVLVFLAFGCGENRAPALATIDTLGPMTLEPGDVLAISGSGFVEGGCSVIFDGIFKAEGIRGEEHRRIKVRGIAVSERLIELAMTPKIVRQLVREAVIFEGRVTVDFPISESAVRIAATSAPVRLHLNPGGLGVATAARRLRGAETTLRAFGVQLDHQERADGLVVVEVQPESAAAVSGITLGDRLLAVDGATVVDVADFSAIDPRTAHRIELVTRAGILKDTTIAPVLPGTLDNDELTAVVLTCIALGLFLAFAAPRRGPDPSTLVMSQDPFTQAVSVAAVSVPLALVPALSLVAVDGLPLLLALFACQGVALALLVFLSTGRGVLAMVPRFLIVPVVAGVSGFLSSGLGLNDIVRSQQGSVFGPFTLSSPFSFLMTAGAVALIWPGRRVRTGPDEHRRRWRVAAGWASAAASASMVTTCLLGGWAIPFVDLTEMSRTPMHLLAGTLVFLVKTWLVLFAARWMAASSLAERRSGTQTMDTPLVRTILFLGGAAGTVTFHLAGISEAVRSAGHVVATALFVTFASALLMSSITASIRGMGRRSARGFKSGLTPSGAEKVG